MRKPRKPIKSIKKKKLAPRIALVINSEVQYDGQGNVIYKDSIDEYLDNVAYFQKRLFEVSGIPKKYFGKQEDDLK